MQFRKRVDNKNAITAARKVVPQIESTGETAFTTIQAAIDAAKPAAPAEVWVKEATYDDARAHLTGALVMAENVAVDGGFAGDETALTEQNWTSNVTLIDGRTANGEAPAPHVLVLNQNCLDDGVTVTGGHAIPPAAMGDGLQTLAAGVHMLIIIAIGNGQVTPPVGSNPVVDGDTVSILATPDPGYYFDHWDGDIVASTPNIELVVNSDMSLTAIFLPCQIVVETPNGGETFVAGQKYQVHWRSEGYTGDAVRRRGSNRTVAQGQCVFGSQIRDAE